MKFKTVLKSLICFYFILSTPFQTLLIEKHHQSFHVDANPVFFDSLFPSFRSTTPETVISDYRQRKRADSRAEHDTDDFDESKVQKTKSVSNVEFYAEVIGKLIGTIRDGFTTLIDDVKQRKSQNTQQMTDVMMQAVEKLHNSTGSDGKHMTNETAATSSLTPINDTMAMKENQEIKLTSSALHHGDANESNGKIKSPIGRSDVVQVIARRTKQKRSNTSQQESDMDEIDVEQLEFPIDADGEMTNERLSTEGTTVDEEDDDARWYKKHPNLFASLSEKHRRRKEKFIQLVHRFIFPSNDTTGEETPDDSSKLTFAIKKGNSTLVDVSPKQFLRMFHRGSDEHAELQQRTKEKLQRAFYKYARIYLLARKGYKEARSFNRMAKESLLDHDDTLTDDNSSEWNEVDSSESLNFMSSDARSNFQAIEAFAILILEIFGAVLGLSLGAIGQIQAGYIFDS